MRHLWGFASALGLLIFVMFGTLALLGGTNDPTAWRSTLVALGGAAVMVLGIVARGDRTALLAKVRQMIGGLGLVVAFVAWFIAVLALFTEPPEAAGFFAVFLVALAAWAQGIAVQTGLPFATAISWLVVIGLVVTGWIAVLFVVLGVLDALGLHQFVKVAWLAIGAVLLGVWTGRRPDRLAAPNALARVTFGTIRSSDRGLLAAGPWRLLRSAPPE